MTVNYRSIIKRKTQLINYFIFISVLFSLCLVSCSGKIIAEYIKEDSYNPNDYLIVWAHSDIQPRKPQERKYYETAIADINNNFKKIDIALVAGDIVNWSNSADDYEWYVNAKGKTSIKYWYEIAGNHDQKDYKDYKKYIKMPLHYSVGIGNILILCLSDENKAAETEISDDAFNWWKEMVIKSQDRIIITMTHGYLKQSNLFGTIIPSRNIRDSQRFANILKNYKVDIWICGHTHLSHSLNKSIRIADDLNGTLFINVSEIRGSGFKNAESFLFFFKKKSNNVIVRSRDHNKREYNLDDLSFKLSRQFQWDNNPPVMRKMEYEIP